MMKTLIILLLVTVSLTDSFSQASIKNIDVHELASILDESLLVIDVRTGLEFAQGYIPGAVNINLYAKDFDKEVENFDRNRPVYLYCRSGHRSIKAAEILVSKGFREVYNLNGGMIQWQKAKKPINY